VTRKPKENRPFLICMVLLAMTAAAPGTLSAQEEPARVEVGALVSALGLQDYGSMGGGVGGRVTVGLTRRIAIDMRVTLFPADAQPGFLSPGGKTLELFAGARGKFVTRRRFSVYGVLLPGLLRFSNTITHADNTSSIMGGRTHFALDMGTGVEFHPTSRWVAHLEWTGPLYAVRGAETGRSDPSPSGAVLILSVPAYIQSSAQFSAGLAYRIGHLKDDSFSAPTHLRWTLGPQFGYSAYTPTLISSLQVTRSSTAGAFASYRITRWLDADGALAGLSGEDRLHTPYSGGRITQGFGGVKVGIRGDRVGYFLKLRAGVQSHDAALKVRGSAAPPVFGRQNTTALDFGAVIETYLPRRLLLRLDVGDVMSFYRPVTILSDGEPVRQPARPSTDSINVAIGFGWRLSR
jgi:hypothetical protein